MMKFTYGNYALQAWKVPHIQGNILADEQLVHPEFVVFSQDGYESGRETKTTVHTCTIEGVEEFTTASGHSLPELAYMQVAKTYNDIEMIYLGLQLLSGYDGKSPICTIEAIEQCATTLKKHHGRKTVIRLAPYLCEGSRSPMESITYMLLSLPVHLGGRGFKKLQLNYPIYSEKYNRQFYADLCWPDKKLIIEYQGSYHSESTQIVSDRERRKILESEGYTVVEVWAKDIYDKDRFEDLVLKLQAITKKRIRYRSEKFIQNYTKIRDILEYAGEQENIRPSDLVQIPRAEVPRREWIQEAYDLYQIYYKKFVRFFFRENLRPRI